MILYAAGSGLIEVLVSPIVEACPFENKDGIMSLLHSFYCWGAVAVILGSTLFFAVFGIKYWKIMTLLWALIPLYNVLNFISCPIEKLVEDGKSMPIRQLLGVPVFWMMIFLMICAGSSEAAMSQWASAFTESALKVSKLIGDLAGPCLFAAFMGMLPIALGWGKADAESRIPLGVVVVGGLLFSQVVTLYIIPVVYLWMDALQTKVLDKIPFFARGHIGNSGN